MVWRATYTTTAGGRGTETILVRVAHTDDGLLMQEIRNEDALYVGQCVGNAVDLSLCNPEGRCNGWIRGTIQGSPANPIIDVEWQNYCCRGTGTFRR